MKRMQDFSSLAYHLPDRVCVAINAGFVILSGAKDLAEWHQRSHSRVCAVLMTPFSEILRSAQDDKSCVG
jgi:hypothetical protein